MDDGFAAKALIILLGVLATALMAFFVWLARALTDVRERVVRIEVSMASLLETRSVNAADAAAKTTRRVEQLEKNAEERKTP